jgi:hypothetical protein
MSMSAPSRTIAPELLVDRYLPRFDRTVVEHIVVEADVPTTWQALCELDLARVHTPLMDAAMAVRGLPMRVGHRLGRAAAPDAPARMPLRGGPPVEGWLSLGEVAEHEIAIGAVGRFWKPAIEWYDVSAMTPEGFAAFDEAGWGRIAASLSLRPYGTGRTLVSYEARTALEDADSARRFARYWVVVRPFARHIMRAALATVAADAEARPR